MDKLIEKGLISITKKDAVTHYQAESPKRIKEHIANKRKKIDEQERLFSSIEKDLNAMHKARIQPPKITIYEGKKGVDALLMRNLDDNPKEILVFGQYLKSEDHIPHYTEQRIKNRIQTRVIIPKSPFGKETQRGDTSSYRKTYLLSNKYNFPATIHIYETCFSIFTYTGKDPVGIYIEDTDIATTMRMIFELVEKNI